MDRAAFYGALRKRESGLFATSLSQSQVDGLESILNEAERRRLPLNQTAYILATVYHETGAKMRPVEENLNYSAKRLTEVWPKRFPTIASASPYANNPKALAEKVYGGRDDLGNTRPGDGWLFRGRGLPQITGLANYTKFGIAADPDAALQMPIALRITFDGMTNGLFTGKKLSDYVLGTKADFVGARQVVNGKDRAGDIAGYAERFAKALRAAGCGSATVATVAKPAPIPSAPLDHVPVTKPKTALSALLGWLGWA